jgi:hypothetical protein
MRVYFDSTSAEVKNPKNGVPQNLRGVQPTKIEFSEDVTTDHPLVRDPKLQPKAVRRQVDELAKQLGERLQLVKHAGRSLPCVVAITQISSRRYTLTITVSSLKDYRIPCGEAFSLALIGMDQLRALVRKHAA